MKNNSGTIREYLQNQLDKIASVAGILLGLLLILMSLRYINISLIMIGAMLITVCGCYLVFGRKFREEHPAPVAGPNFALLVKVGFWSSFAGSVFSLTGELNHRPLIYFILTAIAASMIALQIMFTQKKSTEYLILFEIFLISFSAAGSAYWVFPSLVGSDPWRHVIYIEDFVNFGHIESSRGWTPYLNYPITHLSVVAMKLVTALGSREAMFLAVGLPYILSTVFVYLLGSSISNAKVGLLAALLVNLADIHLQFGVQIMPTSFGIMLFTIILWLIVQDRGKRDMRFRVLALSLLALAVINHSMSAFVTSFFLACLLAGNYVYNIIARDKPRVTAGIVEPMLPAVFLVEMLSYWMYGGYQSGGFLHEVTLIFRQSMEESFVFVDRPTATLVERDYLGLAMNEAGFIIIFALGTIGILLWLYRAHSSKSRFIMITAVVLMTAVARGTPVFSINNFVPGRWWAFIYIPLSLMASFAALSIVQSIRRISVGSMALAATVSALVFFMITSGIPNPDSPIYASKSSYGLLFTESELAAGKDIRYRGLIIGDGAYAEDLLTSFYGITPPATSEMLDKDKLDKGLVIWREVMAERPVRLPSGGVILGKPYEAELELSHDLVYDNAAVKMFLPAPIR